jgi:hypothetical protein
MGNFGLFDQTCQVAVAGPFDLAKHSESAERSYVPNYHAGTVALASGYWRRKLDDHEAKHGKFVAD